MSADAPPIILYSYSSSPFAQKLMLLLAFHHLPYSIVSVPPMPPRDALLLLGITYRRIPVLAIGNDVYFDTSLASVALASHPLAKPLPAPHPGLQYLASVFWTDRALFRIGSSLMDWGKLPKAFLEDRADYMGNKIDGEKMAKARPVFLSALNSHLTVVEKQFDTSSTPYFLSTPTPSYIDVSLYFTLAWVSSFPSPPTFASFPRVLKFITSMQAAYDDAKSISPKPQKISGLEAADIIVSSPPTSVSHLHNDNDPLALKIGDKVVVAPDDIGRRPQEGILVALGAEEVVIEVVAQDGKAKVSVHAPRIGFEVRRSSGRKL